MLWRRTTETRLPAYLILALQVTVGLHAHAQEPDLSRCNNWFVPQRVLQGFQEWPFTSGGGRPFRAKSDFRYDADEDRWQMGFLTDGSAAVYAGGLDNNGVIAFHEHAFTGGRRRLETRPGARYVFRNITRDRFVAEWWLSEDGGETYPLLEWRILYRRRTSSEAP